MARPFLETLRELRAGRTLEDLGEELAKLVESVKETGKSAELTLKMKIKPSKSGAVSYFMIEDSITTKAPQLDRGDTIFFPTKDGGLSRYDQSQAEMPFGKTMDKETGEITEGVA